MRMSSLKSFRTRHKLTLKKAADMFGVHLTAFRRWERDKVSSDRVLEVERETGISRHILRPDVFGPPSERMEDSDRSVPSPFIQAGHSSTPSDLPATLEAFLPWEAEQEFRHEFDGFQPVAMTGGTIAHATIQANLAASIVTRLRGTPCRFFGSDMKILTATTCRYPDGTVSCVRPADGGLSVPEPVVVFEVLSRATAGIDRIVKNREYAAIASVRRYVMLEQERIAATAFFRAEGDWIGHVLGENAQLELPEIGIAFPLAELYEGLDIARAG